MSIDKIPTQALQNVWKCDFLRMIGKDHLGNAQQKVKLSNLLTHVAFFFCETLKHCTV